MKKWIIVMAFAFGGAIAATGCGATQEQVDSRNKLLLQLDDNIMNDIGPKYKKYLDADTTRDPALKANDYGVITDSHRAIARVLSPTTTSVTTKTGG